MADLPEAPPSFLGTGWRFPPTFSGGGADVDMVADTEDIHESLQILLATRTGERPMHETYGCNLDEVVFAEVDQALLKRIYTLVGTAILHHEPRVALRDIAVSQSPLDPALLLMHIEYDVLATNSRYNMVYPFWINEAIVPRR